MFYLVKVTLNQNKVVDYINNSYATNVQVDYIGDDFSILLVYIAPSQNMESIE